MQEADENWLLGFGWGLNFAASTIMIVDFFASDMRASHAIRLALVGLELASVICIVVGIRNRRRRLSVREKVASR